MEIKKMNLILALFTCAIFTLACTFGSIAIAEEKVTVKGEVVDPACYLHMGKRGAEHKVCAEACMKAGQTLAILDDEADTLYLLTGEKPGVDPNAQVKGHIAEIVEAEGTVHAKSGIKGITISSVKASK